MIFILPPLVNISQVPLERIAKIRKNISRDFLIVTPGIRPKESNEDDQKRLATPEEAIKNGADYIVIGRPITQAKDPVNWILLTILV